MKNRDRDDRHSRRREAGNDADSDVDGKKAAEALYGGVSRSKEDVPRCDNCGKRLTNSDDIGCHNCDPRARRGGRPGPVPTPPNQNQ